jgi:hypothetical protein
LSYSLGVSIVIVFSLGVSIVLVFYLYLYTLPYPIYLYTLPYPIAERSIPVLFIQLAFLRGTQIRFVRARLLCLKAFSIKTIKMPIYKALS